MEELRSLADLLDLQVVDLDIDRLLFDRQNLPELVEYRVAHERVVEVASEHDAASAILREIDLGIDKTNGELEIGGLKLSQEQNRLYAGGLSARDADYLRREVEMLDRKRSEMEDEVLELMTRRDTLETEVLTLADALDTARGVETKLESAIADAWKDIDGKLARKEARKRDIVPLIEDDLLELYDTLREAKEGVGVGRLADGVCGGCHLTLTPAEQLEASRSDPPRCIHCRRILVP